ncbi:hypothetical protein IQ268_22180 [Oculatella sp. LEGE 06141]|uniref:hypothetical protein n=1 Tax=Oculatella sp. LEGE 06141 TaxID=1828648 RepID=UPI0018829482|nr:hypothetical protein [Oculatella sp. LEGE 06141]MBE9181274.1 hypothetical protein [Oculatella sp. LEGE 06141]
MYDLSRFTQDDMYDCAIALRGMDLGASSMEEVANRMVRHLYHYLIDPKTGKPACALVRFFKTHPYGELTQDLQEAARAILKGRPVSLKTKCLTLLATAGDKPQWNTRYGSTGHQAIPLVDLDFIYRAPMILQLIQQFGLEVNTVLEPATSLIMDLERTTFNVFYVPDALGSDHIPAQVEFVIPHRIGSVLGFGGMLPSGNLFAIILFTKTLVPQETADLFKWVSAYVRIAVSTFDRELVFAQGQLVR